MIDFGTHTTNVLVCIMKVSKMTHYYVVLHIYIYVYRAKNKIVFSCHGGTYCHMRTGAYGQVTYIWHREKLPLNAILRLELYWQTPNNAK